MPVVILFHKTTQTVELQLTGNVILYFRPLTKEYQLKLFCGGYNYFVISTVKVICCAELSSSQYDGKCDWSTRAAVLMRQSGTRAAVNK